MRTRANPKVEAICGVPLFAECTRKDLEHMATIADEVDIREGKEITAEGTPGREFFVILEGTAEVRRKGRRVATLGPGDFFGEIALVSRRLRTATVKATSPVRALVITDRAFRRLLDENPQIQSKVLKALAERVLGDNL